jgi:hypothetical protein
MFVDNVATATSQVQQTGNLITVGGEEVSTQLDVGDTIFIHGYSVGLEARY